MQYLTNYESTWPRPTYLTRHLFSAIEVIDFRIPRAQSKSGPDKELVLKGLPVALLQPILPLTSSSQAASLVTGKPAQQ